MSYTIKDVAKYAGVSTATVSKVINRSSTISEATAEKVRSVMKELNYLPNKQAQNFARKASNHILYITNLEKDTAFLNPHMFEIMSGAQREINKKNYAFSVISVTKEDIVKTIEPFILQKSADGLIIHVAVITKELVNILIKTNMPHIVIGCPDFESQICWIDNNNYLSGELAVDHLLEEGYQRIAFIGGEDEDQITSHRFIGLKQGLEGRGYELNSKLVKRGASTIENGYQMMDELLNSAIPMDAIVCANNHLALGVVKAIKDHQLSIPKDIGVITFDNYPFSQIIDPMLTVVNIDVYDMGHQAGKLILNKIKKPNLQVQTYTTLPNVIVRESTRRRKE